MNINLPAEATRFVEALVASGEFNSADEAVAEGVRLLMAQKRIQMEIQKGIDELNAGNWVDGREVFAELRQRSHRSQADDSSE